MLWVRVCDFVRETCKVKVIFFNYCDLCIEQDQNYLMHWLNLHFFVTIIFRFNQPGESGFVLLGDLTVETSTDPEPDDSWICDPPSPCDVQFKNANVVINGKSSLRDKSRSDPKVSVKVAFKLRHVEKFWKSKVFD